MDAGEPARTLGLDDEEKALVKDLCLITMKPTMYIANVQDDGFENNPLLEKVRAFAAKKARQLCQFVPLLKRKFRS